MFWLPCGWAVAACCFLDNSNKKTKATDFEHALMTAVVSCSMARAVSDKAWAATRICQSRVDLWAERFMGAVLRK